MHHALHLSAIRKICGSGRGLDLFSAYLNYKHVDVKIQVESEEIMSFEGVGELKDFHN